VSRDIGQSAGQNVGMKVTDVPATVGENATVDPSTIVAPVPVVDEARTARRERWRLVMRSKSAIVGSIILLFWIFCAIFGETLAPKDVYATNVIDKLERPNGEYLFGTDRLGRDVFSRVLAGARDILIVAPAATVLGTVLGTILGLLTGYFGGAVDNLLSRLIDAVLAIPGLLLAVVAVTAVGPSMRTVILIVGLAFTPLIARTVRSAVLVERQLDYVQAAKLRNERAPFIMFREILPNVMPPILVEFTVRLGYAIFTVAGLSFLGFGIQAPSPDWGLSISENYTFLNAGDWWPVLFPALAVASLIVAVNLISDGVLQAVEQ
jgi:peptide/nickel transport system permease protein